MFPIPLLKPCRLKWEIPLKHIKRPEPRKRDYGHGATCIRHCNLKEIAQGKRNNNLARCGQECKNPAAGTAGFMYRMSFPGLQPRKRGCARTHYFTASFSALPGVNFTTREAGMRHSSPVRGLRPLRSLRSTTFEKLPAKAVEGNLFAVGDGFGPFT